MVDFVDGTAFNYEQGQRARKLFAAVVLAALDDAIADDKKYGNGPEQIARWARSRDGREVLSCAGIDPNERVVKGLMEFVSQGRAHLGRAVARRKRTASRAGTGPGRSGLICATRDLWETRPSGRVLHFCGHLAAACVPQVRVNPRT